MNVNGRDDMLWLYVRGSTDESICYGYTLDGTASTDEAICYGIYVRGSTDETICYMVYVRAGTTERGGGLLYVDGCFLLDRQHLKVIFGKLSSVQSILRRNFLRPSHSPRSAQNLGMTECSNCKFLAERIKTLEARISVLEGQLEMARHPENHTLESAGILHEIYQG
ncbi:hypothetical protein Tco_0378872 [Tanacetum coccineum]